MVERARRLRMGLAHSSPGASGDTARPNYVGPSGNGLVERMKAGESPSNQGRTVWAPLSVSRRRSRGQRKTPQWSAARRTPSVIGRAPQGVETLPAPFGAPLPSPLVREHSPRERGDGNPGAPRALREQGRRSFDFLRAGCLTCESDARAPKRRRAFWRNEPEVVSCSRSPSPRHARA
jgi:hypothetical protein